MLRPMNCLKVCLFGLPLAFLLPSAMGASVELVVSTDRTFYNQGSDNGIFFQVSVATSSSEEEANPSPRRHFALVVDRSGSMTGPFISSVREAV